MNPAMGQQNQPATSVKRATSHPVLRELETQKHRLSRPCSEKAAPSLSLQSKFHRVKRENSLSQRDRAPSRDTKEEPKLPPSSTPLQFVVTPSPPPPWSGRPTIRKPLCPHLLEPPAPAPPRPPSSSNTRGRPTSYRWWRRNGKPRQSQVRKECTTFSARWVNRTPASHLVLWSPTDITLAQRDTPAPHSPTFATDHSVAARGRGSNNFRALAALLSRWSRTAQLRRTKSLTMACCSSAGDSLCVSILFVHCIVYRFCFPFVYRRVYVLMLLSFLFSQYMQVDAGTFNVPAFVYFHSDLHWLPVFIFLYINTFS